MPARRIAILISTELSYGRGVVDGITRYLRLRRRDWTVAFQPWAGPMRDDALATLRPDGILFRLSPGGDRKRFARLRCPAIDVSTDPFVPGLPQVTVDTGFLGAMAAEYFLERNFRHFGMLRTNQAHYRGREKAFAARLAREGITPHATRGPQDIEALAKWLAPLPRPLGFFCGTDHQALSVAYAARAAGIRIPESMALLAFGNDKQICELTEQPLSSVIPPAEEIGATAARMLDDMLDGTSPRQLHVRIPPPGVAERQSSDIVSVSDPLLSEALSYIRENATRGIQVADVARALAATRRNLERRFRKHLDRSPRQEILRVKMNHARRLLSLTQLPIARVAEACGFPSHVRFTQTFGLEEGLAPIEYRRQHQAGLLAED